MGLRAIGWLPILLAGCSPLPVPADPPKPPVVVIEEEPPPPPFVKEIKEKKPRPKAESEFFCAKPEIKRGVYYGMIDNVQVRFEVRQWGKSDPECYMYFGDKFTIEDYDCNRFAEEFYTPSMRFDRKPPFLIDWKKVDRILKLGHKLACKKNEADNNKRIAEIESEEAFKLFKGIEE
jgi:hypothetical protein